MNLSLIATAPLIVQLHVATVVPAFVLGTWMMVFSRKGSKAHRMVGRVYLALISVAATAAIFIRAPLSQGFALGPLVISPIHIFVLVAAWGVYAAFAYIRRGDIKGHQRAMRGLYFGGMVLAGLFAFIPGRLMWRMFLQ